MNGSLNRWPMNVRQKENGWRMNWMLLECQVWMSIFNVKSSERNSCELLKRGGDTHGHAAHAAHAAHLHPPTRVAHLGADLGRQLTKTMTKTIAITTRYIETHRMILKHIETPGVGHTSGDMQCFYDSTLIHNARLISMSLMSLGTRNSETSGTLWNSLTGETDLRSDFGTGSSDQAGSRFKHIWMIWNDFDFLTFPHRRHSAAAAAHAAAGKTVIQVRICSNVANHLMNRSMKRLKKCLVEALKFWLCRESVWLFVPISFLCQLQKWLWRRLRRSIRSGHTATSGTFWSRTV